MFDPSRLICENLTRKDDHLLFAGQDTTSLAARYGTPLYLMDEDMIRTRCRSYLSSVKAAFGGKGHVLYASKACCFRHMMTIMKEEGMGIDVVSVGEIYTAFSAGFPMERAYFHSNNKTDADIRYAMEHGVGYLMVDNYEELEAVSRIAGEKGQKQKVLLRLTPGIDPHTFEAVATGKVDSKFGVAIETGQAEDFTAKALSLDGIDLRGFHCHVGSQVFDSDVFLRAADIMLDFIAMIKEKYGYEAEQLDLGGGYGVRYLPSDPTLNIEANIAEVGAHVTAYCQKLGIAVPDVGFEPGRSIVADSGMTLYTVGMVKKIPDVANYVSIDGGMTDNIRYALYNAPYTLLAANRMNETADMKCTVVGRCCESGDIIQPDVTMPAGIGRGDLVAVCTTGAYNYSMASNYNRVPRPPVVMCKGGESFVAVRGETPEDLAQLDEI